VLYHISVLNSFSVLKNSLHFVCSLISGHLGFSSILPIYLNNAAVDINIQVSFILVRKVL
jgi:hypothetical protein